MGSPTLPVPPDLAQILRQKQLTQNMANLPVTPQSQPQAPQQQQMSQINPRDMALADYRQALEQGAPQLSQYHPSPGRKILGAVLGALAGMHDPKSGVETARNIVYGPYESQLSDYQKKIANAKAAFEAENTVSEQEAKESELEAQKDAELSRGKAESAREVSYGNKTPGLTFDQRKELAEVNHPNVPKKTTVKEEAVTLELKNGEKIQTALKKTDADGTLSFSYIDENGKPQYIGLNAIKPGTVHPLETKEVTPKTEKNSTEYQDFKTGYLQKHPNATGDEVTEAYTQATQKPPQGIMITPDNKVVSVKPGSTIPQGSTTTAGKSSEDVLTTPTRQMKETAPKVIDLANRAKQLIDTQVKTLGPMASRWNEFMAGQVGSPNPEFTKLRTDITLLQTLLMRMHIGARGGTSMYQHFVDLINSGKQSPENMKAAIDEIVAYANDIEKGGSEDKNQSVTHIYNPETGKIEEVKK